MAVIDVRVILNMSSFTHYKAVVGTKRIIRKNYIRPHKNKMGKQ